MLRISEEKCCRETGRRWHRKTQERVRSSQSSGQQFIPFFPLGHDVFKPPWESGRNKKRSWHPQNY